MTRDEIYDHLAQVYLGKKNKATEKKRQQFNAWLVINIMIAAVIFSSAFYGFTAFLVHRTDSLQNRVIYALSNGPIRLNYNLVNPFPPVKTFSLSIPQINVAKYGKLQFTVRGEDGGSPGIIRVEVRNQRDEVASVFVDGVKADWKHVSISLAEFDKITDWSEIKEISFIIESWNAEKTRGSILIDDICFST
jgi:hypothetical protein